MRRIKNAHKEKNERGITLVVLVITIIILIILATVSINAVIGENGLIQSAKNSKDSAENAVAQETGKMNSLLTEYANIMAEDAEITQPGEGGENPNPGGDEEEPEPEPQPGDPIDGTLAVGPQVAEGMTPVKYVDNVGWIKTIATDTEWYNYGEKKWANIVLGGATFNTLGSYEILDENATYSMLVWIPRYAYKITSMYHQSGSGAGNIDIVFIDTDNKGKDGTKAYSTEYPSASTGNGMTDYVVHPAFNWDGVPLAGFWVGKFETSNNGGQIQIKGGVSSWRNINVSTIHNTCIAMNDSGNSYGLSTDDSVVDPHMMKNTEWGAVAYLSQSIYGKNSEVAVNSNTSYCTGGESGTSYRTNTPQSTTGDVTGIYDMSGGASEYVAAYVGSGNSNGSSLVSAPSRYKDIYSSYIAPTSGGHYGDAVYETSSNSSSWYSDTSIFPDSNGPFFQRGGHYNVDSDSGLFYFSYDNGKDLYSNFSFRVVVPVLRYKGK